MCALKMPVGLSLLDLPVLNWGFVTLSDLAWVPIEEVVSYVWFTCQRFWWLGSLGPFGTDQLGLFGIPLVFEEFSGWYDPGPTISEVELNWIKGSNPFTALLA